MSELQDIGAQVSATASEIAGWAQALHGKAGQLRQAAARAAESNTHGASRVAQMLAYAADSCDSAAQHLMAGKSAAEMFVEMHVGGSVSNGGSTGPSVEADMGSWIGTAFGLEKSSTRNGGINLLPSTDPAGQMGAEVEGVEGFTDVVIHANENEFGLRVGPAISPADLAEVIGATPELANRPIRLLACKAGKLNDGAAQQVADRLDQPILAPSDTVHLAQGRVFVRMIVGPNIFTPSGTWRLFRPRK